MAKHYAKCPNCGADVHVSYYSNMMEHGVIPSGKCGKCGKKIYTTTFWEVEE